jgi:valyl-tRNA synthetase
VAHPDDERFKKYFGKFAVTPLFHARVPILPAEHADPEKGTGILMICTFGDINDVQYWKKTKLPLRQVLGRDGKLLEVKFGTGVYESLNPSAANENYSKLAGLFANQAKKVVVEQLSATGQLIGAAKPTTQAVKYYEKGDRPLEFIPTRQWFIKILEFKKELIAQGKKINWHPEYMRVRYEQWVEGLNQDWCISRQRYFGVPFPVWYPLKPNGEPDYSGPIFADNKKLPIDPMIECPPGFTEADRGKKFIGDPDVMDTWATSSLTPQLSSHWGIDPARHEKLYPADLRPQAHEIIRTWAFYTITKSWMHAREIPWKNIAISGWVVDPDKKKISKSKGNSKVTPESLMETYSADALRYWASRAKLGSDTIYDEGIFKIGQRFITKMFNASKFVLMQVGEAGDLKVSEICEPVDLSFVSRIKTLIENSEKNFREYDYAAALLETENLFWDFCDNYVEIVKARAYQQRDQASGRSAMATLSFTHKAFLRLLAPIIPYITEEVWSWGYAKSGESIHRAAWPSATELGGVKVGDGAIYEAACGVLNKIRGEKTIKQKSLKWPVASVVISAPAPILAMIKTVEADLKLAGNLRVNAFDFKSKAEGETEYSVTLSDTAE